MAVAPKRAAPESPDVVEDDVNLEAEGLEEDVEEYNLELEESGEVVTEEEDVAEEDTSTEEPDADAPVVFDKKQQAEINSIIKARLDRQEAKLVKDLSKSAGIEIVRDDIVPATRLWGLLKANPELSKDIDDIIALSLSQGRAKAPDAANNSTDAITQRLELKEAILDLKAADPLFGKNADKILAWAENEGYEVTNAKALKLAVLAWKGSHGKVEEVIQKSTTQRKQTTKQMLQKRATVQSTKSGQTRSGASDYGKMSDSDLLASEGLKLFTED